jgi:tRNA(adenine34) deaminase
MQDEFWLRQALTLAETAAKQGEVPVGAIIVRDGKILGSGFNQPIGTCDPTAHAEIIALREAALLTNNYRLPEAVLYCTLEPCAMCAGAIIQARIAKVVFAALDPKAGAALSVAQLLNHPQLNHRVEISHGLLAEEAGQLLKQFFQLRRGKTHAAGGH